MESEEVDRLENVGFEGQGLDNNSLALDGRRPPQYPRSKFPLENHNM